MFNSQQFFTISNAEGRWPNRTYFDILPGSVLYHEGTKEEYIDWLYTSAEEDPAVAEELTKIVDAVSVSHLVRLVVPDRFNDFRGNAVIGLVKQAMEQLKEQS
jgi:hypothetical protein